MCAKKTSIYDEISLSVVMTITPDVSVWMDRLVLLSRVLLHVIAEVQILHLFVRR